MAYVDMAYLAQHPGFCERVRIAMISAAVDVGGEAFDGSDYRRLRRALAVNVMHDQDNYAQRFSWLVAANPGISYTSTDSDIQYTVNSRWDAIAGAVQEPTP